jgi:hypothetical protein
VLFGVNFEYIFEKSLQNIFLTVPRPIFADGPPADELRIIYHHQFSGFGMRFACTTSLIK